LAPASSRRIPGADEEQLCYMAKLAFVSGKEVKLRAAEPFGGPLTVRLGKADHAISHELAAGIGIT
jgi:Fe2+ transport system protein FeoA